ncbi:MAG TPA: 3-hydroxyacyl-CoA dehydrogenase NAD-binding domain-containing protein, partial [Novosphingobium sp.]|nr:3-hydroxyacyl-CoA dehydrogenase NAD-binding domain-containing protein [Novosphingobium sp.]
MSDPLPGAQAHIEAALKLCSQIDDLPADTPLIEIAKVGVIGAGTMGGGITMNFLSAGIPVTIIEAEQAALDRGVAVMAKNYEASVKRGRIEAADAQAAMARLTPSLSFDDLADCDLVIEAVYESMDVKKDVFGRLDAIVKQGAILASNTSYLDV